MLFEWLFPKYIDIIAKCSAIFYDEPRVIAPLLRFAVQLTTNKDGRLKFDCSSQNGFLLFREIGKIVIEYGRRLLGYTPDDQKLYDHKLKGIVLILTIMDNMSTGNYIPFCVFDLYGDSVLSESLNISLQLSLSISFDDIMVRFFYSIFCPD
jgi:exportin-7